MTSFTLLWLLWMHVSTIESPTIPSNCALARLEGNGLKSKSQHKHFHSSQPPEDPTPDQYRFVAQKAICLNAYSAGKASIPQSHYRRPLTVHVPDHIA